MSDERGDPPEPIDVEALMQDLRARVAEKKAQGIYQTDALVQESFELGGSFDPERLERLQSEAVIEQRLAVAPSTRPLVGRAVEQAKRFVVRASFHNLAEVTDQVSRFNGELLAYVTALGEEVERLRGEVAALRGAGEAHGAVPSESARLAELVAGREPALRLRATEAPEALAQAPEGAAASVAVSGTEGLDLAQAGRLARGLARALAPGGGAALAVAGGGLDPLALATLLETAGLDGVRRLRDAEDPGAQIVVARL